MASNLRVLTAPTATDLTTLAAVQADLGLPEGSGLTRLQDLIRQASSLITEYCNQPLVRTRYIETWRRYHYPGFAGWDTPGFGLYLGNHRRPLLLSRMPIVALIGVTIDGVSQDISAIEWDESGRLHHIWGGGAIAVTYDAGFVVPGQPGADLPASIERACIDTVVSLWHRTTRGDPLLKREQIEGIGSTEYYDQTVLGGKMLPDTAMQALDRYRAINV